MRNKSEIKCWKLKQKWTDGYLKDFYNFQMLHQQLYENHHLILDQLDLHQDEDHVQSSHCPTVFHKKSNISSTSSPEPSHFIMAQQFRVIKDSRQYEDGFRVSSSEIDQNHLQMGPPAHIPTLKNLKIISSEEPSSTSMPDLGKFYDEFFQLEKGMRFQTKSIKSPLRSPSIFVFKLLLP